MSKQTMIDPKAETMTDPKAETKEYVDQADQWILLGSDDDSYLVATHITLETLRKVVYKLAKSQPRYAAMILAGAIEGLADRVAELAEAATPDDDS